MSTKYDVRVKRIEEQLNAGGGVPPSARGPYWGWSDDGSELDFADIKAQLLEQFGTTRGAVFYTIGWMQPEDVEGDGDGLGSEPT